MSPTPSPPTTGTSTTQAPSAFPTGDTNAVESRPKKKRFVSAPIRAVSACATRPAASASGSESAHTTSTRGVIRRPGPGERTTATPAASEPGVSGSSAPGTSGPPPRRAPRRLLEEHAGSAVASGADPGRDAAERARRRHEQRGLEPADRTEQAQLRRRARLREQPPARRRHGEL